MSAKFKCAVGSYMVCEGIVISPEHIKQKKHTCKKGGPNHNIIKVLWIIVLYSTEYIFISSAGVTGRHCLVGAGAFCLIRLYAAQNIL